MVELVGADTADELRRRSIDIYLRGTEYAGQKGIIIADTKFEFGVVDGEVILIDEVLTPDSSRFWPASTYEPGRSQESFDKQPVRDYLETLGWNKQPPAPELPPEVVMSTARRYLEVRDRLADPDRPIEFTEDTWQ